MQFGLGLARAGLCSIPQHSTGSRGSTVKARQTPRRLVLAFGGKFSWGYGPSFFSMLGFLVEWELYTKSKPSGKPDGHCTSFHDQISEVIQHHFCYRHNPALITGKEPPITSWWEECQSHIVRRTCGMGEIFFLSGFLWKMHCFIIYCTAITHITSNGKYTHPLPQAPQI